MTTDIIFSDGVLATAAVGVLIKLVMKFVDRDKELLQSHAALRKELREELDKCQDELHKTHPELETWRQKYYDQMEALNDLKIEVSSLKAQLSSEQDDIPSQDQKNDDA